MEFPRLVYKSASEHILVENDAEHAEALKAGWHDSVPDANAAKRAPAPVAIKAGTVGDTAAKTPAPPDSAPAKGKKSPAAPAAGKNPWD